MEGFRVKWPEEFGGVKAYSGGDGSSFRDPALSKEAAEYCIGLMREFLGDSVADSLTLVNLGNVDFVVVGPEGTKGPERAEK